MIHGSFNREHSSPCGIVRPRQCAATGGADGPSCRNTARARAEKLNGLPDERPHGASGSADGHPVRSRSVAGAECRRAGCRAAHRARRRDAVVECVVASHAVLAEDAQPQTWRDLVTWALAPTATRRDIIAKARPRTIPRGSEVGSKSTASAVFHGDESQAASGPPRHGTVSERRRSPTRSPRGSVPEAGSGTDNALAPRLEAGPVRTIVPYWRSSRACRRSARCRDRSAERGADVLRDENRSAGRRPAHRNRNKSRYCRGAAS